MPGWLVLGLVLVGTFGSGLAAWLLTPVALRADLEILWPILSGSKNDIASVSQSAERLAEQREGIVLRESVTDNQAKAVTGDEKPELERAMAQELEASRQQEQDWEAERQALNAKLSELTAELNEIGNSGETATAAKTALESELADLSAQLDEAKVGKQELGQKLAAMTRQLEASGQQVRRWATEKRELEEKLSKLGAQHGEPSQARENVALQPAGAMPQDCAPLFTLRFKHSELQPIASDLSAKVERLRDWLSTHPDAKVQVEGHTDASGLEEFNMLLSYRRARAVVALLIEAGVSDEQLATRAFGEHSPMPGLPAESGRNRRVSLRVTGAQECSNKLTEGGAE